MRAKQDRAGDAGRERGLAVLIHGDAAFAGEGVVQETLNLSLLPAYTVGGALHVVVNNQVGFTTGPDQARSSIYCSAVAKMLHSPIFHVNGEDPEAVAQVVKLALAFRARWKRDVVVDMYCYRRRGHNESDEPSFTQPLLYREIRQRKSVRDGYLDHLDALGGVTREQAAAIEEAARQHLEAELTRAKSSKPARPDPLPRLWDPYRGGPEPDDEPETGIDAARARSLLERLVTLPEGFHAHPKLDRLLGPRREMAQGRRPLDWASAELLALASLAADGVRVRFTGQDSERGTFSQRHAVLHDDETGEPWSPLQHVSDGQAPVDIANSPLSEAGALGFEYGYSLDCPDGLVLWEAQFGDFVNAAQVIVDQFLAAAESKWQRLSGLVLLLPHGFEGQGPEHSSARLERFLQLAAGDNIQVAQPTTPAQYLHLLRRQALRPWRKPLVVMTPKSLLRDARATSPLDDVTRGRFERLLVDAPEPGKVRRIVLCTGKLFYDLAEARRERGRGDVALVRLEQLYPLQEAALRAVLAAFAPGTPAVWAQEEPENMGAWCHVRARFGGLLPQLCCVSRPESASPATGSLAAHRLEQAEIVERALA
jgi:2-oxoglutarate dehydrogenase E1 component